MDKMKKDKNFELRVYEFIGVKLFISFLFAVRDIVWNFFTLNEVPERFDKDQIINCTKNKVVNKVINWIRNRVLNPIIKCLFSLRDDVRYIFTSIIPKKNKKNHIFDKIKESYIYKIIHKLLDTYYYCSVNKLEDLKKARIYLLFRMLWCATHFFLIAFGIQKIGYNIFTLFPRASILYSFYNAYWVMFYRYNYVRCKNIRCNNVNKKLKCEVLKEKYKGEWKKVSEEDRYKTLKRECKKILEEDKYETLKEKYEVKRQELLEELRLCDSEIPEHSYEFVGGSNWEKGRQYNDDDWNSISFDELINTSTLGQLYQLRGCLNRVLESIDGADFDNVELVTLIPCTKKGYRLVLKR